MTEYSEMRCDGPNCDNAKQLEPPLIGGRLDRYIYVDVLHYGGKVHFCCMRCLLEWAQEQLAKEN